MYSGFCAWVCPCILNNIVNTILKNIIHIFTNLSALVHFGTRMNASRQKVKLQGQGEVQRAGKCTFGLVNVMYWKLLDWISSNFQCWCSSWQVWMLQCLQSKCQRSRSGHDQWLSRRRHTEFDAMRWVLISSSVINVHRGPIKTRHQTLVHNFAK